MVLVTCFHWGNNSQHNKGSESPVWPAFSCGEMGEKLVTEQGRKIGGPRGHKVMVQGFFFFHLNKKKEVELTQEVT